MARKKEFERDVVLAAAIRTFATYGYEGASTERLTKEMGIGRQSLYDTFGDKWSLYKEALQQYCFANVAALSLSLQKGTSVLTAIEATLLSFAARVADGNEGGCLGVGAICEFGQREREINAIGQMAHGRLQSAFEGAIRRAKENGEMASDIDPVATALFFCSTLSGMKLAARGGASSGDISAIAKTAMRCLR